MAKKRKRSPQKKKASGGHGKRGSNITDAFRLRFYQEVWRGAAASEQWEKYKDTGLSRNTINDLVKQGKNEFQRIKMVAGLEMLCKIMAQTEEGIRRIWQEIDNPVKERTVTTYIHEDGTEEIRETVKYGNSNFPAKMNALVKFLELQAKLTGLFEKDADGDAGQEYEVIDLPVKSRADVERWQELAAERITPAQIETMDPFEQKLLEVRVAEDESLESDYDTGDLE